MSNKIVGTNDNDVLVATAEGQSLFGLGGDDRLESEFNRSRLHGGAGNDALTTSLAFSPPPFSALLEGLVWQSGGPGDNTLVSDLSVNNTSFDPELFSFAQFGVVQRTQGGADTISSNTFIDYAQVGDIRTMVSSGSGADTIMVRADFGSAVGSGTYAETIVRAGRGDDTVNAYAATGFDSYVFDYENNNRAVNRIYGGAGDDALTATAFAASGSGGTAENFVFGGAGDDQITVTGGTNSNDDSGVALNFVTGDAGDDTIFASLSEGNDDSSTFENVLSGGSGRDSISASIVAGPWTSATGVNRLDGGSGGDVIDASADTYGDNGSIAENEIRSGSGSDTVTANASAGGEGGAATARNVVQGNGGADRIAVVAEARGVDGSASNDVSGGGGNDSIEATAVVETGQGRNNVTGGSGDDTIEATAEVGNGGEGINNFSGGSGEDTLIGAIVGNTIGRSLLYGDAGRDSLIAIGGTENVLDGGDGKDRLTGSVNADLLLGGGAADIFFFDVRMAQGTDTLGDFDGARDILAFDGLVDTGAPGLADDLDRITTVTDLGPGDDVVARFESGSELVFAGLGTGAVTSIADLVDDPLSQIV